MSTALDDWNAGNAQGRIYTVCLSAGGRKVRPSGSRRPFADRVDWARNFPDQGPGRYRVSWHTFGGDQVGKTLRFTTRA
jgi:hypothetical protein